MYNKGILFLEMGELEQAEREFRALLQLEPNDREGLEMLGKTYIIMLMIDWESKKDIKKMRWRCSKSGLQLTLVNFQGV